MMLDSLEYGSAQCVQFGTYCRHNIGLANQGIKYLIYYLVIFEHTLD